MSVNSIGNQKTIQQIIDEGAKSTKDRKTGELDKDQFLNLLVTQLKYQDPLNPVNDKEFIGQMAQFSSLEQMQNLNSTFSSSNAFAMIGKTVTATIESASGEKNELTGTVSNVKISGGKTMLVVNGKEVSVNSVRDVSEGNPFAQSNISAYTGLIGFDVNGSIMDHETGEKVNVSGNVKELKSGENMDYAVLDGVKTNIYSITSEESLFGSEEKREYLEGMIGKKLQAVIIDPDTGRRLEAKGELVDFNIDYLGGIKATLNKVEVPVESISKITLDEQEEEE